MEKESQMYNEEWLRVLGFAESEAQVEFTNDISIMSGGSGEYSPYDISPYNYVKEGLEYLFAKTQPENEPPPLRFDSDSDSKGAEMETPTPMPIVVSETDASTSGETDASTSGETDAPTSGETENQQYLVVRIQNSAITCLSEMTQDEGGAVNELESWDVFPWNYRFAERLKVSISKQQDYWKSKGIDVSSDIILDYLYQVGTTTLFLVGNDKDVSTTTTTKTAVFPVEQYPLLFATISPPPPPLSTNE